MPIIDATKKQPRLGRRPSPPDRRNRLMGEILDPFMADYAKYFPAGVPEGSRHYNPGSVLDQGMTGCCVAFGLTGHLNSAPIKQPLKGMTPFDLYRRIVLADPWSDNDFEATLPDDQLQSGTDVHAGIKVVQSLGYVKIYLRARSVADVRAWHLAGFGGTVVGFTWTAGMMATDADGFVSYSGDVEGGHCVQTTGWNDHTRRNGRVMPALRLQNSWGRGWGQNGRFWISADDLGALMQDDGEVWGFTEIDMRGRISG